MGIISFPPKPTIMSNKVYKSKGQDGLSLNFSDGKYHIVLRYDLLCIFNGVSLWLIILI